MKRAAFAVLVVTLSFVAAQSALAHCEVPCGVYDDEMRIEMIREHITTIEKAMNSIVSLSGESPVNYNQIVRWTTNKEKHAEELQHIVTQYFMTQRVKPAHDGDKLDDGYVKKITLLHMMVVHAMKAKQTTDLEQIDQLRKLTDEFNKAYFDKK